MSFSIRNTRKKGTDNLNSDIDFSEAVNVTKSEYTKMADINNIMNTYIEGAYPTIEPGGEWQEHSVEQTQNALLINNIANNLWMDLSDSEKAKYKSKIDYTYTLFEGTEYETAEQISREQDNSDTNNNNTNSNINNSNNNQVNDRT